MSELITAFSPEVCKKMGYYVYRLVDPRNGHTFYVGKGKNNRVFDHVKNAETIYEEVKEELKKESKENIPITESEVKKSLKISTIIDIKNAGLEVIYIIQRWGIDKEETAFIVEAAVMDCFPGLTNEQSGHHSNDYGMINAITLQANQSIKEFEEPEDIDKYMIIKVRNDWIEYRGDRYKATRSAWKINPVNARKHPYILSVTDGIVGEIYYADEWVAVTEGDDMGRYEFNGHIVEDKEITDRFLHKRIPEKYTKKGMASPCLYCKK